MTRGSPMSLSVDMDFGGFGWGLLLEWKKFVRPIKVGVSTKTENGALDLGSIAEDALTDKKKKF